jgi:dihydroorotase
VLFGGNGRRDDFVLEGIRVVDPTQEIDEVLTVAVEKGVISRLEPTAATANGKIVAPAFIDPHVHLRTPGREDEE